MRVSDAEHFQVITAVRCAILLRAHSEPMVKRLTR
jgi:hypothetical protein